MAAPHVSATAALVIASGVIGSHPSPLALERRLKLTARPMGPARHYGAGLLDAAAATAPVVAP
jgi:serine protease